MGTFNVDFTIGSADATGREFPLVGMVDTGVALFNCPGANSGRVGHSAGRKREWFSLANGSTVEMDIGLALIEMNGRARTVHVAFVHDPEIILIGAMTLERFGVAADPVHKRLVPARITM